MLANKKMNAYPGNRKACDESRLHDCDVKETKVPSPYTQTVVQVSNKLVVQDVAMEEERCVAMEHVLYQSELNDPRAQHLVL